MKRYLMMKLMKAVVLYKTDKITFYSKAMSCLVIAGIILKLFHLLPIPWYMVFAPLWMPLAVFICIDVFRWSRGQGR